MVTRTLSTDYSVGLRLVPPPEFSRTLGVPRIVRKATTPRDYRFPKVSPSILWFSRFSTFLAAGLVFSTFLAAGWVFSSLGDAALRPTRLFSITLRLLPPSRRLIPLSTKQQRSTPCYSRSVQLQIRQFSMIFHYFESP